MGRLIFEIIVYAGDNSDNFLPWGELVAVVDGEVALRGALDFAEFATGIFGKLFGSFAGVFGGGFNHGGLNLIERVERVGDGVVVSIVIVDGDAHFEEFVHAVGELAHQFHFGCGDGDGDVDAEAGMNVFGLIVLSGIVGDVGGADGDVFLRDAVAREEGNDFGFGIVLLGIKGGEVLADGFITDGPRHLVGFDNAFGEAFDLDTAVAVGESAESHVDENTCQQESCGDDS